MKLYFDDVQDWNVWASVHWDGVEAIDADTIITQEQVRVNPNPGVFNAWAFKHSKSKLDAKWPVHPNLVIEVDDHSQISVWYAVRPIHGEQTKPLNTFKMMQACLQYQLGGVWMDEVPNPAHVEKVWFDPQIDEMGEMKKKLRAQDRWNHTLHREFTERGGMSTSALKVKTSSENFAKAREAAKIKHAETADKKARQLLVILDAGGSYEDIASIYSCSIEAARMAVSRARKRLGVEVPAEEAPKPVQALVAPPTAVPEPVMPTLPPKRAKDDDQDLVDMIAGLG